MGRRMACDDETGGGRDKSPLLIHRTHKDAWRHPRVLPGAGPTRLPVPPTFLRSNQLFTDSLCHRTIKWNWLFFQTMNACELGGKRGQETVEALRGPYEEASAWFAAVIRNTAGSTQTR